MCQKKKETLRQGGDVDGILEFQMLMWPVCTATVSVSSLCDVKLQFNRVHVGKSLAFHGNSL